MPSMTVSKCRVSAGRKKGGGRVEAANSMASGISPAITPMRIVQALSDDTSYGCERINLVIIHQ